MYSAHITASSTVKTIPVHRALPEGQDFLGSLGPEARAASEGKVIVNDQIVQSQLQQATPNLSSGTDYGPGVDGATIPPQQVSREPYVVQHSKPREADSIQCKKFPQIGHSFEAWQEYLREAVLAASPSGMEAFKWILEVEDSSRTFESFANTGAFTSLDGKLLLILNTCIPGTNHPLRQRIVQLKQQERITNSGTLSGRQVLWLIYEHFKINSEDKMLTDQAKLQRIILTNGNLQLFKHHWDTHIMHMHERPTDNSLYMLMLLQLDGLQRDHEFYMEYVLWKKQPVTERTYTNISKLIDTFLSEKQQQKNRRSVLSDAIPGLTDVRAFGNADTKSKNSKPGKDKGKGKLNEEHKGQCFSWLNWGICTTPNCKWKHDKAFKAALKVDGSSNKDKKGKSKGTKPSKGDSGAKSREPSADKRKVVTDMSKVCQLYLQNKCTKGQSCKLHHNEPCKHHATGSCNKGTACPFPHWNATIAVVSPPGIGAGNGAGAAATGR